MRRHKASSATRHLVHRSAACDSDIEAALANLDSIAAIEPRVEGAEALMYVATDFYERKTGGGELPPSTLKVPVELGESWDFDDKALMRTKYPKLCERFEF